MITESEQYYKAVIKNFEQMIFVYQGFFSTYTKRIEYLEKENKELRDNLNEYHRNNDILQSAFDETIPE